MAKLILLVDDSAATREMYTKQLQADGYDVLQAADGERGVAVATDRRPDLIFMNMALPGIDGWTAIALLKQDERTAAIPVLALTGFAEKAARIEAERAGADGFIEKPCRPTQLMEEVRRRLGPVAT